MSYVLSNRSLRCTDEKAPEMVPAGRVLGAGGNEIDRIGEAFLLEAARMEGLGLSGKKLVARKWAVKVEDRSSVCFKERGWTMRSIIPALSWSQHYIPMSRPPLK